MKVLIATKTRRGEGACVSGITFEGRVVRLLAANDNAARRFGQEFQVGEVWDIEGNPPPSLAPPHLQDLIVTRARRLAPMSGPERFIERFHPAVDGGIEVLFEGKVEGGSAASLRVGDEDGIPTVATQFWRPAEPLTFENNAYVCAAGRESISLQYVGFQEPLPNIPAGTLVSVSLADRKGDRCDVHLCGWFETNVVKPSAALSRSADASRPATSVSKPQVNKLSRSADAIRPAPPANNSKGDEPSRSADPGRPTPPVNDPDLSYLLSMEPPPDAGWQSNHEDSGPPASQSRRSTPSTAPAQVAMPSLESLEPPRVWDNAGDVETLFIRCEEELHRVFGFDAFRGPQADIIRAVLAGKDALAILPTGGGKSLCFQLPSLVREGLTVVVSPLISLMQDQVQQLRALGVPAVFLNSTLSREEYFEATDAVRTGRVRLLYAAPETLVRADTQNLIAQAGVRLFAIDEAHCISSWGHDFRPEYRGLMPIRRRFAQASCLALTATATPRVQEDIRAQLGLTEDEVFIAGFDRPNLFLGAARRDGSMTQILNFLKGREEQQGIIYAATRDGVERLAAALETRGFRAAAYHAGLDAGLRRQRQQQFNKDEIQIIVATIAFGMGINKSNVRYVMHYNLPECLESYYQEVGRAGRDGLRSDCLLLHDAADIMTRRRLIEKGAPEEVRGRLVRLDAMVRYAQAVSCRRSVLLPYFGDSAPLEPCGICDRCVAAESEEEIERVEVGEAARKVMAAIQQTGGYFGAGHLIKVLRGSKAEAITSRKHDRLAVYNTGGERSEVEWRQLINRLIELGWLDQDQQHGSLQLNSRSREALDGGEVWVPREEASGAEETASQHDSELFSALRRLRQDLAAQEGVPPYVIFSDRTLTEMATFYPHSDASLRRMHGVGEHKARTYGDQFLAVIRDYCNQRGIAEKAVGAVTMQKPDRVPRKSSPRAREIGAEFAAGRTLDELVERHGFVESTLLNHLYRWLEEGGRIPPGRLLEECRMPEAERNRALEVMEDRGDAQLRPIRDEVGEHVEYRDLHLLRLYRAAKREE